MGQAIERLAGDCDDLEVVSLWRRGDDLGAAVKNADVIIDFSLPEATMDVAAAAVAAQKPLVCGVSGLDAAQMSALDTAAEAIPVLYDRNMSRGITILDATIRQVAQAIGSDFDVEIHETHHIHKKDAPSGTALKLGEAIMASSTLSDADISYQSERCGEVPGDHAVILSSPTERLEFRHSVTTRDVFAEGALAAARWIIDRPAGRYSMHDVLFAD